LTNGSVSKGLGLGRCNPSHRHWGRSGLYGENISDALMMAILVMWVAIAMPRSCASRTMQGS
jgi:hypothetical protein